MASTEKVLQLFEVLTVWERVVEYREDMLRQFRGDAVISADQFSLMMAESRTEDWPDATFRLLLAAHKETLTDDACIKYMNSPLSHLDELHALMETLQSQMAHFWLFRTEQLAQEGMMGFPTESTHQNLH